MNILYDLGHIFGGIVYTLIGYLKPELIPFLIAIGAIFIIYQLDESWHIDDEAWRDIREFLVGIFIGLGIILLLTLTGLR